MRACPILDYCHVDSMLQLMTGITSLIATRSYRKLMTRMKSA